MKQQFKAGDLVEVRSTDEILATLDARACLDELPFMPEMLRFTGRRFRVSGRAHKTCDTVNQTGGRRMRDAVHLENLRCDGSGHDGCQASCLLFWKTAWLKPAASGAPDTGTVPAMGPPPAALVTNASHGDATGATVYRCQATALYDATSALRWWDLRQYAEDLTSGNVSVGRMLRTWFFQGLHKLMQLGLGYRIWHALYDKLQLRVGGFRYPFVPGKLARGSATPAADLNLQAGERVRVKSHENILETVDQAKLNRGMRFDPEMVPYCERTFTVAARVERIIHEKTGRMIRMGTPSVILEGVVCRSEFSACRLFCPRAIPSYWREIWLERVSVPAGSAQSSPRPE